jgi:hypothetical protein
VSQKRSFLRRLSVRLFPQGKTIYLANGGTLEKAQLMAGHADPRTTKLYDRTSNAVSLDEVEQVAF